MNYEDALIYLPLEDGKDVEDVYEERLFELRMFFLARVPVSKVFNAKIELLKKIEEAYKLLSNDHADSDYSPVNLKAYDSELLLDLVSTFQQNTSLLKGEIVRCSSAKMLIFLVSQMLENMRNYARKWDLNLPLEASEIRVTVAPDEVGLLLEIEHMKSDGIISLRDLVKLNSNSLLYREAIRLSLWNKLEGNG